MHLIINKQGSYTQKKEPYSHETHKKPNGNDPLQEHSG